MHRLIIDSTSILQLKLFWELFESVIKSEKHSNATPCELDLILNRVTVVHQEHPQPSLAISTVSRIEAISL